MLSIENFITNLTNCLLPQAILSQTDSNRIWAHLRKARERTQENSSGEIILHELVFRDYWKIPRKLSPTRSSLED